MTSFGALVDESINQGSGPYVVKVAGQISHWVGSLCPKDGDVPRFLQLYVYDTENEITNRMHFFPRSNSSQVNEAVVQALCSMFVGINGYVRLFRSAREMCSIPEFGITASGTLVAIVSGGNLGSQDFDVIDRSKDNRPHRISRLHPSYMPLQYPLLFPAGEPGWSPELRLLYSDDEEDRKLTPSMYYSYQFHDRQGICNILKVDPIEKC